MADPTKEKQALQRPTTTKKDAAGRQLSECGPGLHPMAQLDADLFKSLKDGEHCLRGSTQPRHTLTADEDTLAALVC